MKTQDGKTQDARLEERIAELQRLLALTKRQLTLALCEVARMKAAEMVAEPWREKTVREAERGRHELP